MTNVRVVATPLGIVLNAMLNVSPVQDSLLLSVLHVPPIILHSRTVEHVSAVKTASTMKIQNESALTDSMRLTANASNVMRLV